MEENNNQEEVSTISMRDLFAEFLVRWKLIICLGIIFALLMGALSYVRSGRSSGGSSSDSSGNVTFSQTALDSAKSALSKADADQVENLYATYATFQNNNLAVQQYLKNASAFVEQAKTPVSRTNQYYVTTSVSDIQQYYTNIPLALDDFHQISGIPQNADGTSQSNNVLLSLYDGGDKGFAELSLGADTVTGSNGAQHVILTVTVLADGEDESNAIASSMEQSIQAATSDLNRVDGTSSVSLINSTNSSDAGNSLRGIQQDLISYSNVLTTDIYNLNNNFVDNLSDEQKTYFNLLAAKDAQAFTTSEKSNNAEALSNATTGGRSVSKKYVAVGAVVGILLGLLYVTLVYIFQKKVRTVKDVSEHWNLTVLDSFYFSKQTVDPLKKWAARIRGRNADSLATKAVMLAEDIRILADRNSLKNIFVQADISDQDAKQVIVALSDSLKNQGVTLSTGDALSNADDLKLMSDADGVIAFVHIRKTETDSLDRYMEYCRRYSARILGAVTIADTLE